MEATKFREEVKLNKDLSEDAAEQATKIALRAILRRVKPESAREVKSYLPGEWQSEFQLPGELDASITSATVLNEIGRALSISTERAQKILPHITRVLAKL